MLSSKYICRLFVFVFLLSFLSNPGIPATAQFEPAPIDQAGTLFKERKFKDVIQLCNGALGALDRSNDILSRVTLRNLLGASYIKMREFERAHFYLNEGLRLAVDKAAHNQILISDSHYWLGIYYAELDSVEKSVYHHEAALGIRKKFDRADGLKAAESMVGLGELYLYVVQDLRVANRHFENAMQIREAVLKPDDFELYVAYFYMAQVNRRLGDQDKALAFAFKALTVVNASNNYHMYLERCYTLLGDIYYAKTDFHNAIEYLRKGILLSAQTDGHTNYNLIRKAINLGVAYLEVNQPDEAIASFRRSLKIFHKHQHHNSALKAENFLHMGRTFQKMENFDSAKFYLDLCLKLRMEDYGRKHYLTSEAYRYIASHFEKVGHFDSAARYYQKSLTSWIDDFDKSEILVNPTIRQIDDRYAVLEIVGNKGAALLKLHQSHLGGMVHLSASMQCFKLADTLMQLSRNSYQEGAKLFIADHYHHIYENGLHAAYLLFEKTGDKQYYADALGFMEKSKAILLAESLNKAEIFTRVGLPDSIRELERNLNTALATYRSQVENATNEDQQRLHAQIFEMSQRQQQLLDTIASRYPNYFRIKYQKLSSLREIQDYSEKHNSAIIEYFWGDDRIFVLAVSGKKMIFREIGGVDSLSQNVQDYFKSIQETPSWIDNGLSFNTFFANAHRIYKQLVDPVLKDVGDEKLIIVRDGPLLMIPFESLPVSAVNVGTKDFQQLDYLLHHHTVSYAHSGDLLLKNAAGNSGLRMDNKVLGFSFSPLSAPEAISSGRGMNELPGAAREITAISQIFPGTFLLGEEATERKFKTLAPGFDILHLAVHGKSDPEKQFSGSLFFKNAQDDVEDGELHVYELYDLALKARLAVLSACESGTGKILRGEGVFSIARGFAYAGCPSTVMTLWPVSDVASAVIMGDFYNSLSQGEDIDRALRQAKLNYLHDTDPQLAHPVFWAAYVPTGNMSPVVAVSPVPKVLRMVVALAFLVLIGFWLRNLRRRRTAPESHAEATTN